MSSLSNEPFAYQDNEKRSDVVSAVRRDKFLFLISELGDGVTEAKCVIAGRLVTRATSDESWAQSIPVKNASVVSAVHVYDAYGLEIACSFIRHVYNIGERRWRLDQRLPRRVAIHPVASCCRSGHAQRSLRVLGSHPAAHPTRRITAEDAWLSAGRRSTAAN